MMTFGMLFLSLCVSMTCSFSGVGGPWWLGPWSKRQEWRHYFWRTLIISFCCLQQQHRLLLTFFQSNSRQTWKLSQRVYKPVRWLSPLLLMKQAHDEHAVESSRNNLFVNRVCTTSHLFRHIFIEHFCYRRTWMHRFTILPEDTCRSEELGIDPVTWLEDSCVMLLFLFNVCYERSLTDASHGYRKPRDQL